MYWCHRPGETVGKGGDGRHTLFADQPVEPLREVLAEASPIRMGQSAAREADKIHKQGQSLSVVTSWGWGRKHRRRAPTDPLAYCS